MKLYIESGGALYLVEENLDDYNLEKSIARQVIARMLQRAVTRVKKEERK